MKCVYVLKDFLTKESIVLRAIFVVSFWVVETFSTRKYYSVQSFFYWSDGLGMDFVLLICFAVCASLVIIYDINRIYNMFFKGKLLYCIRMCTEDCEGTGIENFLQIGNISADITASERVE